MESNLPKISPNLEISRVVEAENGKRFVIYYDNDNIDNVFFRKGRGPVWNEWIDINKMVQENKELKQEMKFNRYFYVIMIILSFIIALYVR